MIAIIGGGVTGLSAAWWLAREGHAVPPRDAVPRGPEASTNTLRHAQATRLDLRAVVLKDRTLIEVCDNGIGISADVIFGRGLTGMRERVRALGGNFELTGESGRTCVRCSLPLDQDVA